MGEVYTSADRRARDLLASGLRPRAPAARGGAARARALRPRLRRLLRRAAPLVRLALARRRGLLGRRPALGAGAAASRSDALLELGDEIAELAHGAPRALAGWAVVRPAERLGEVARRVLAQAARAQLVEQVTIGGLGHGHLPLDDGTPYAPPRRRSVLLRLALLDAALELLHHVRVAQRRDVAELPALGDVAQQPAHDLARARLGQVVGPDDALGPRELADALGHVIADVLHELVRAVAVARERHEGGHGLARVLVLLADHRSLGHLLVGDDRGLDLGRGHPVARDVEHVVDAADDPEVAVLVLAGRVTDEVHVPAELVPIGLDEAVVVAVERAQHPGPRAAQRQQALVRAGVLAVLLGHHAGFDPGQRPRRRARLRVRDARQRRDHDVARLRLPPRVDDRAALAADHHVVPEPRLRIDRLPDRAEQPQGGEVVPLGILDPPFDRGANRGRRGVEDRHPVPLDDLEPDVLVGVVGRALVHHRRTAVGQRPVDD